MNASPCDIEILSNQRIVVRNFKAQLASGVLIQFGYRCIIDSRVVALELGMFDNQGLQRWIACSLADAEYRRISGAAAVEPCRCSVYLDLVQIVMAVPFKPFGANADLPETVDKFRNAPRQRNCRPRQTKSERITKTNLDRLVIFFGKLH